MPGRWSQCPGVYAAARRVRSGFLPVTRDATGGVKPPPVRLLRSTTRRGRTHVQHCLVPGAGIRPPCGTRTLRDCGEILLSARQQPHQVPS
jgi:hypothetical protein